MKLIARESKHRPNVIDCHPLFREHFGNKLKASSQKRKAKGENPWQEAHSRLYEYYKSLPEKLYGKELPDTLEEMEPLFVAVAHGCQAGKYTEALDELYWNRIQRGNEFYLKRQIFVSDFNFTDSISQIELLQSAWKLDLAVLSNFFEKIWTIPSKDLTIENRMFVLNVVSFNLRALGLLREAAQPMQAGLEIRAKNCDWKNAASAAGNLSEFHLTSGDVPQAVDYGRQSVDFADRSGDEYEREVDLTVLANARHQAGELHESESLFKESEDLLKKRTPEYHYRYSQSGFQFCDLLLAQGKVQEVLERAKQTIEIAIRNRWLLTIALDNFLWGEHICWKRSTKNLKGLRDL